MLLSRIPLFAAAALVLPMLAGCGSKGGDKPDSTAAPTQAPAPPPPPVAPPPVVTPPPADANALNEACKKTFATNCALPCEHNAQTTIKDPARQKTALNQCMVACLEQAEKACVKH